MKGAIAALAIIATSTVHGFYLPGVAPHSFTGGESVELKVNKLRYLLINYDYFYIMKHSISLFTNLTCISLSFLSQFGSHSITI